MEGSTFLLHNCVAEHNNKVIWVDFKLPSLGNGSIGNDDLLSLAPTPVVTPRSLVNLPRNPRVDEVFFRTQGSIRGEDDGYALSALIGNPRHDCWALLSEKFERII